MQWSLRYASRSFGNTSVLAANPLTTKRSPRNSTTHRSGSMARTPRWRRTLNAQRRHDQGIAAERVETRAVTLQPNQRQHVQVLEAQRPPTSQHEHDLPPVEIDADNESFYGRCQPTNQGTAGEGICDDGPLYNEEDYDDPPQDSSSNHIVELRPDLTSTKDDAEPQPTNSNDQESAIPAIAAAQFEPQPTNSNDQESAIPATAAAQFEPQPTDSTAVTAGNLSKRPRTQELATPAIAAAQFEPQPTDSIEDPMTVTAGNLSKRPRTQELATPSIPEKPPALTTPGTPAIPETPVIPEIPVILATPAICAVPLFSDQERHISLGNRPDPLITIPPNVEWSGQQVFEHLFPDWKCGGKDTSRVLWFWFSIVHYNILRQSVARLHGNAFAPLNSECRVVPTKKFTIKRKHPLKSCACPGGNCSPNAHNICQQYGTLARLAEVMEPSRRDLGRAMILLFWKGFIFGLEHLFVS